MGQRELAVVESVKLEDRLTEDLLVVSLDHLEENCAGQSQLMRQWGFEKAKAIRKVKDLKRLLKLRNAEIGREVRNNPGEFGLDRGTDKAIEEISLLDADYQNLQDQVIQAEYEEDLLSAFVESIRDRKDQLRNEVLLFGQMYFSKPNTSLSEPANRVVQAETARRAANSLEDYDLGVPTRRPKPKPKK